MHDLLKEREVATRTAGYSRTAMGFHWAIALLIFTAFPVGVYMHDLPLSPDKLRLLNYHKWLGVAVFMLATLRVVWRLTHRPPELPASLAKWERMGAASMHGLLYALIFFVPLGGWLMSSAKGFQTVWLGVLPIPDLIGKDKEIGRLLEQVHQIADFTMLGLMGGHVAAALKHHFLAGDDVLVRMIPFLRRPLRVTGNGSTTSRA
jgi:cytochrome b561